MGKKAKAGLLACAIAAAGLGGAYVHGAQQYRDRFIDGISINGVDASGKTVDEVEALLKEKTESEYTLDLQFRNEVQETLAASDIGFEYQSAGKAEKLLRAQNPYDWLSGHMGTKRNYMVDTSFTYDKDALKKSLLALPEADPKNGEEPKDAYLVLGSDDRFYIEPDTQGSIIEPEGLLAAVEAGLDAGADEIDIAAAPEAYKTAAVTLDDKNLNKRKDDLNAFLNVKATYHMTDGPDEVLDGHTLKDWIKSTTVGGKTQYALDPVYIRVKADEYIASLAAKDDTELNSIAFESTKLGTVQLPTNEFGHKLDQEKMSEELYKNLMARKSFTSDPEYSMNVMPDIGPEGTYVEVDIPNQHVYYYVKGKLTWESDCVSGTEQNAGRRTPTGVYSLYYKQLNRTLHGPPRADGTPSYSSFVNYWMAFYKGYGLHDASWRSEYGGNIFQYSGSHGCVNLPKKKAAELYDILDVGTTVLIVRPDKKAEEALKAAEEKKQEEEKKEETKKQESSAGSAAGGASNASGNASSGSGAQSSNQSSSRSGAQSAQPAAQGQSGQSSAASTTQQVQNNSSDTQPVQQNGQAAAAAASTTAAPAEEGAAEAEAEAQNSSPAETTGPAAEIAAPAQEAPAGADGAESAAD